MRHGRHGHLLEGQEGHDRQHRRGRGGGTPAWRPPVLRGGSSTSGATSGAGFTGFAFVASPKGRRGGDGEPRRQAPLRRGGGLGAADGRGRRSRRRTDALESITHETRVLVLLAVLARQPVEVGVTWVSVWRWLKRMDSILTAVVQGELGLCPAPLAASSQRRGRGAGGELLAALVAPRPSMGVLRANNEGKLFAGHGLAGFGAHLESCSPRLLDEAWSTPPPVAHAHAPSRHERAGCVVALAGQRLCGRINKPPHVTATPGSLGEVPPTTTARTSRRSRRRRLATTQPSPWRTTMSTYEGNEAAEITPQEENQLRSVHRLLCDYGAKKKVLKLLYDPNKIN